MEFGTGSPAYAAIRWLWFLATICVIGAIAFRFFVLPNARSLADEVRNEVAARAAYVGLVSAAFAVAANGLRLMAQSIALLGEIGPDLMILVTGTSWGSAWLIHTAAATAALAAFALAVRGVPAAWGLAALSVPALAAAPALAGHAATVPDLQPLPILADALHVLAAGAWIGGLLVLLTAGMPGARASAARTGQITALVHAFTPVALAGAAILIATGAFASIVHLNRPTDLITTTWGQLLGFKILAAIGVAGFGARNFRSSRRTAAGEEAGDGIRTTATAEITVGAIVLLITAFLVAVSPPAESMDSAASPGPGVESEV